MIEDFLLEENCTQMHLFSFIYSVTSDLGAELIASNHSLYVHTYVWHAPMKIVLILWNFLSSSTSCNGAITIAQHVAFLQSMYVCKYVCMNVGWTSHL